MRVRAQVAVIILAHSNPVKAHFVTTAHYVITRAFRNKISAHFVTKRIL